MKREAVKLILGVTILAASIGVVIAGANPTAMADLKSGLQAVADSFAKGDADGASKQAADVAKSASVEDAMHLFGLRTKKGFGIGDAAGKFTPDGIEAKIMGYSKKAPTKADIAKDADVLAMMAYRTAAIAEFALKKAPEKDMGDKKVKDWNTYATNMRSGALELADAIKAQDGAKVKPAAAKVFSSCSSCHGTFRD
jgi:Cytochrome C'